MMETWNGKANRLDSRLSVGVWAAVSLAFGYICISSRAPMIEEDIAARCRAALVSRQIKPEGLSVSGRDVLLTGTETSAIASEETRIMLEHVKGVRVVKVQYGSGEAASGAYAGPKQEEQVDARARVIQEMINGVLQNERIEFKPDSATLTPRSRIVLDSIVSILSRAPNLRCEIRGNSQASSNEQRDWMMSLQRALATEDYLVSKGVADWRLSAQAFRTGTGAGQPGGRHQIEFVVKER
jgi:outer membrane protein OmpA-like peptidoglycan-associated protein